MTYFLNLFSPETYAAFGRSDRSVSGFRPRQGNAATRVRPGDMLICYMTRLSRWVGLLEVLDGPFSDTTPIFYPEDDPFNVRFRVRPLVWLPVDKAVPIHDEEVWDSLSFTRGQDQSTSTWTGRLRSSLRELSDDDGAFLAALMMGQGDGGRLYPLDETDSKKLTTTRVRRADKDVSVVVPDDTAKDAELAVAPSEVRESIRIQAMIGEIGARMGMQIWVPRSDRSAVVSEWQGEQRPLLERLPLNYDDTTLRTIEQIDVLWLKGRAIKRAFEVEHTTSVYSGILRMADLLALQPNMDIRLHIVAPLARREKVFNELRRPVFSLLDRGPLSESCTYLSYDSVRELAGQPHLAHLADSVLDDYEEEAED